jgi:hypothetical protein
MPYHFEFDSTNGILRGCIEGRVTDDDLRKYYRDAEEYVKRTDPSAGITDLSRVTSFEVSSDTIGELANRQPAMPDPTRPRVIIAAATHVFGMARMFGLRGERTRPKHHVVQTQREALEFLGVSGEPPFSPLERI